MDKKLPHRLRDVRDEKGYFQKEVAKQVGIQNSTLSSYENGTRTPDPYMLLELAKIYEVSVDYLLGYHDCTSAAVDDELQDYMEALLAWYGNGSESKKQKIKQLKDIFITITNEK